MCPASTTNQPIIACLDGVLEVQSQRAATYQRFDEGFKNYLNHGAEGPYRFLFGELTPVFQQLSAQINTYEQQLRTLSQVEAATALRRLQECESERLRLTLALQSLKSAVHQNKFHWQHAANASLTTVPAVTCSCVDDEKQPSQADVEGALKELYTELETNTQEINETLMELQQMREDLLN